MQVLEEFCYHFNNRVIFAAMLSTLAGFISLNAFLLYAD